MKLDKHNYIMWNELYITWWELYELKVLMICVDACLHLIKTISILKHKELNNIGLFGSFKNLILILFFKLVMIMVVVKVWL